MRNNIEFLRKRLQSLKADYENARYEYYDYYEYYLLRLFRNPSCDCAYAEHRLTQLFRDYTDKFLAYQKLNKYFYLVIRNSKEGNKR